MSPKNAVPNSKSYKLYPNDPQDSTKYEPAVSDQPGTNWYDSSSNILYVLMKGDGEIVVQTQSVVVVSSVFVCNCRAWFAYMECRVKWSPN